MARTYKMFVSADDGETYTEAPGTITVDGNGIATYTEGPMQFADDGKIYQWRAIEDASTANEVVRPFTYSNALNVGPDLPVITTQPTSQSVLAGTTVTFTVAASGTVDSWRWEVSTDFGLTWAAINGAISASYSPGSALASQNGNRYRAFAINVSGETGTNVVTLSVIAQTTLKISVAAQAGAITGGVYPIQLGSLQGLDSTGRNVVIENLSGATLPHCRIEKNHIAMMDGAWIFYSYPNIILDEDAGNTGQIFIGACTSDGRRNIAAYDIDSREYSLYVLNSDALQIDDHNQPAFCLNSAGKLVVAYTEHPGTMKVQVANTAHDLSGGFATASTPATSGLCSYAYMFRLASTSRIYLWTRVEPLKRWHLATSTDEGATWSSFAETMRPTTTINNNYPQMYSDGVDKIWIGMNETKPNGTEPFNRAIYCFYYDGTNYRAPNNDLIGSAITTTTGLPSSAEIFPQTGEMIKRSVADIATGSDGHPRILYYVFPDGDEDRHVLYHARWTGSAWVTSLVVDEGASFVNPPSNSYTAQGRFNRANINEICTGVTVGSRKEIQIFRTVDNGLTWTKVIDVTTGSIEHNFRPMPVHGLTSALNVNQNVPKWFWMGNGQYNSFTSYKHCIKAYPARYAWGALVKVDLPGDAEVPLVVKSGGVTGSETFELFDDLGLDYVHLGAMRFNDSHVATRATDYVTGSDDRTINTPRLIDTDEATWPAIEQISGTPTITIAPTITGASDYSVVWVGKRNGNLATQNLLANDAFTLRLTNENKAEVAINQVSDGASSLVADNAINTEYALLAGVFDAGTTLAIRNGDVEKTAVASSNVLTGASANSTLSLRDAAFLVLQGPVALSKDYTDTLYAAISDPATFAAAQQYGSNLITNGTFTTDTTGWSANNALLTQSSGEARVDFLGAAARITQAGLTLVSGRTYQVDFKARRGTYVGDLAVEISLAVGFGVVLSVTLTDSTTEFSGQFVSTVTSATIRFSRNTVATGTIFLDDITLREVLI